MNSSHKKKENMFVKDHECFIHLDLNDVESYTTGIYMEVKEDGDDNNAEDCYKPTRFLSGISITVKQDSEEEEIEEIEDEDSSSSKEEEDKTSDSSSMMEGLDEGFGEASETASDTKDFQNIAYANTTPAKRSLRRRKLGDQNANRASKDLEELQDAIKQIKEKRMSASRELQLLQDLLGVSSVTDSSIQRSASEDFPTRQNASVVDGCLAEQSGEEIEGSPSKMAQFIEMSNSCTAEQIGELNQEREELQSRLTVLDEMLSTLTDVTFKVQLDATKDALFAHQKKTWTIISQLEERLIEAQNKLVKAEEKEDLANKTIHSLETALQDMQSDKLRMQKRLCTSLDALEKLKEEKSVAMSQELEELREELEEFRHVADELHREMERKDEENVELKMEIMRLQSEFKNESEMKEKAIDSRDERINELEEELAALSELRLRSEKMEKEKILQSLELERIKEEEIARLKEELRQETYSKITELEAKVRNQEEEIVSLRKENAELKQKLDSFTRKLQDDDDDERLVNNAELPAELNSTKQSAQMPYNQISSSKEIERLKQRLRESEERARNAQDHTDRLEMLLNEKMIALNKLQLTLSSQTKDLMKLEKAYYTLRRHLNRTYKSPSSR